MERHDRLVCKRWDTARSLGPYGCDQTFSSGSDSAAVSEGKEILVAYLSVKISTPRRNVRIVSTAKLPSHVGANVQIRQAEVS